MYFSIIFKLFIIKYLKLYFKLDIKRWGLGIGDWGLVTINLKK